MRLLITTAAMALSALLTTLPAHGQSTLLSAAGGNDANSEQEEPATQILSDSLVYDEVDKTSRFGGEVIMTRGLLTLRADALDLREDEEGFQFGIATMTDGGRVRIRQEQPEDFEVLQGLGERAEYDGKAETFDLIGKARLTRFICGKPLDSVSGQRVRYYEKTGTYQAFGGANSDDQNGRVRSVAQPRAKVDAAIAECRALQAQGKLPPDVPAPEGSE
jgi:lipopolysaccharide export system protein LptA